MSSPVKNYDKYTYALKRKSEKETSPPTRSSTTMLLSVDPNTGLIPLTMNRDGFAVAEDGTLMSRLVSPPLRTCTAVEVAANNKKGVNPKHNAFNKPAPVDGWQLLVQASEGDLSEEDLALLQWDTVQGLLHHYHVTNPVDVARAQLVWKQKQNSILDGNASEVSEVREVIEQPSQSRLRTQPISQISYGRPASPRSGNGPKFVPGHQKPLTWKNNAVASRVDCGPTKMGSSFNASGSQ